MLMQGSRLSVRLECPAQHAPVTCGLVSGPGRAGPGAGLDLCMVLCAHCLRMQLRCSVLRQMRLALGGHRVEHVSLRHFNILRAAHINSTVLHLPHEMHLPVDKGMPVDEQQGMSISFSHTTGQCCTVAAGLSACAGLLCY